MTVEGVGREAVLGSRRFSNLRRLGLGVADAAVPSVANLGIGVVAARSMPLADFGVFSTALIGLMLCVGLSRSVHGDVLVLTQRSAAHDAKGRVASSIASVAVVGTLLGLSLGIVGTVVLLTGGRSSTWGWTLLVAGAVIPLVLLQDHYRWVAYASGRLGISIWSNVAWALVSVPVLVIVGMVNAPRLTAPVAIAVWGSTSIFGLLASMWLLRTVPSRPRSCPWIRANRTLARALVLDFGLLQASAQGALIFLALLTSPTDLGLLRKAQLWFGPVTMVTTGLLAALQALLAQRSDDAAARRIGLWVGTAFALGAMGYGAVVFVLPDDWGSALAGDGWSAARQFVWPLTAQMATGLLGGCAGIALRVRGQVDVQVRLRWFIAPASLAVVAVAASTSGALAAAWGLAAVSAVTAAVWCGLLATSTRTSDTRKLAPVAEEAG